MKLTFTLIGFCFFSAVVAQTPTPPPPSHPPVTQSPAFQPPSVTQPPALQTPPPSSQPSSSAAKPPQGPPATLSPTLSSQPIAPVSAGTIFTSPGIATIKGGEWVGTEHLYNLSPNLGIEIDLIMPVGQNIPITEASVKEVLLSALKKGHITERVPLMLDKTPLPLFHLLLIIQPIEKGYVAYCQGSLLEGAQMKRVQLKSDITWQTISWERQELVVFPSEQIKTQVDQTVQNIAAAFVERYTSYQGQR